MTNCIVKSWLVLFQNKQYKHTLLLLPRLQVISAIKKLKGGIFVGFVGFHQRRQKVCEGVEKL